MSDQEGFSFEGLDPFAARLAKLQAWRDLGIDPYPARFAEAGEIEDIATAREKGNQWDGLVSVAGRIKAMRGQGALCFVDLWDRTGKIQVLFQKDKLEAEWFERLQLLDIGDFIRVSGTLFISRRGELTLEVKGWAIITKSLRPLPDQWKGLQDIEQRQRQRYAELIVNDSVRERFLKRSQLVAACRDFMAKHGFIEVETPVLEQIPGGADAEPFVTHHNALDEDFYLRISLEMHLKRLMVGGFERVYEIGKVFRNEGISPQHLQEFTMFEFYWGYASYLELMDFVQELYRNVAQECFGSLVVDNGEQNLDFGVDWPRTPYAQLLRDYAGIDILTASDDDLIACAVSHDVRTGGGGDQSATAEGLGQLGRGRLLDLLYKKTARPHLIQPQFITDLPLEFSPLAKKKADEPRLTERFVIVINGSEVGNAFSELNDPIDQRERFEEQEKLRLKGDLEAQRLDGDFIRALEYGMPPTAGFGVGIDRLFAVLAGLESVRETVLFPTMRPER